MKWNIDTYQLLEKGSAPLIDRKICCSQSISCSIMKLILLKFSFPEEAKCARMDKTSVFKEHFDEVNSLTHKCILSRTIEALELMHGCVWQMQGLHMDVKIHIKACINSA